MRLTPEEVTVDTRVSLLCSMCSMQLHIQASDYLPTELVKAILQCAYS